MKNSPKKFNVPGIPKLETIKKKKHIDNKGMTVTIPLKYLMFFVWNLLYNIPITKNKPAEAKPWANISKRLPEIEKISNENSPNTLIFICPIEAYAIIRLISTWTEALILVYITEKIQNIHTKILKKIVASWKEGKSILKKPYNPIFNSIAANMTEPSVGDSTCASGNHKWTGKMGILTLKEIKNKHHKRYSIERLNSVYHSKGIKVVPKFI